MPSQCPFCHQKYTRSDAYEKHLQTAQAGLDIVLTSTVQFINMESTVSNNPDTRARQDSDYESDPGPAGSEPDEFCCDIAYESGTEVFDDSRSPSASKQIHYKGAGQVIGDVDGLAHENSNLRDDPWAPFNSEQGFKLASWFIAGKVSKTRVNQYFSSGLGDAESVGYSAPSTR